MMCTVFFVDRRPKSKSKLALAQALKLDVNKNVMHVRRVVVQFIRSRLSIDCLKVDAIIARPNILPNNYYNNKEEKKKDIFFSTK